MNGTTQRFTARDDWRTSALTRRMAALATLGIRIVVEHAHDDLTGTTCTVFHHSPRSLLPERAALPGAKHLMRLFLSGELERTDPEHPFLDALAAIANFEALEQWRLRLIPCCLAADAIPTGGTPAQARRSRLMPGTPPSSGTDLLPLQNAATAAALARIGVPIHSIDQRDATPIYLTARSPVPLHEQTPFTVPALLGLFQNGELPSDHPFVIGRQAVLNFIQLLRTCQDAVQHTTITWRNRRDRRSATLLASASSQAQDIAFHHMK